MGSCFCRDLVFISVSCYLKICLSVTNYPTRLKKEPGIELIYKTEYICFIK